MMAAMLLAGYWNYNYRGNHKFKTLEPISAAMLVKTDASGNLQWTKVYKEAHSNGAYGVLEAPGGGYILAGYTWIEDSGTGSYDVWLFKTDEYGVVPEDWTLMLVSLFMAAILPIFINRKIRRAI
jgi:hypothetical protein